MPSASIISPAGREALLRHFDAFLAHLPEPVERRTVTTSLGPTQILFMGDPHHPPIIALHGAMSGSALMGYELIALARRFRLILPDLPGQSVHGPQTRPDMRTPALPRWLAEVMDACSVTRAHLLGASWGGAVALRAAFNPEFGGPDRFTRLALLVPAGIVRGSGWRGFTRVAIPLFRYRRSPTPANLQRFLAPHFTHADELWTAYLADAIRAFKLDLRPPPLATDDELRSLAIPLSVIAASDDIHFPGPPMLDRIRRLIPSARTTLIPNCLHAPPMTDDFRRWFADEIAAFLA